MIPGSQPSKSRVLLLDDDAGVLTLARKSLERAGYEVLAAASAGEAERLLRESAGSIDLLVLDYQIGGDVSGLEFFRALSEKMTLPPAILATGFSDETRVLEALRAGARDVIRKAGDFLESLPLAVGRVLREVQNEQRAAEAESAMIAAQAASRAKDHFLAVLSHELRTPLTPVLAVLHEMEQESDVPGRVREALQLIRRNIELETRLIDDLLDITRISRGKMNLQKRPLDLYEELRHVIEICEPEALSKGIRLQVDLQARRHRIMGDPTRIQQIFWNLVRNAIKFTPAGGEVSVQATDGRDERIRVEVRDNGIGIANELLAKVFDAFEQGGPEMTHRYGGLGLGLAISRALVTMHGGTIEALSAGTGKGAAFVVELATVATALPTESLSGVPEETSSPDHARALSILLVEDHADTARMMSRLLSKSGHRVSVADSIASAQRMSAADRFDLMISDIGLPDGSGLDLMRSLRTKSNLRGIVLSGYAMLSDISRSQEAGFIEHLTKPVNFRELELAIDRVRASLPDKSR